MFFSFGSRIRHPFYPGLTPTPAGEATRTCTALYGSYAELARAKAVEVRRAVFVIHTEGERFLNALERNELWRKYEVPIFAMLLDSAGRVVAYECEVQDGLHVSPKHPASEGKSEITCDCGRPGSKLKVA
jgi:hypothetical protein